jgi:hypothetical protein
MEPIVLNDAGRQLAEPMPSLAQVLHACPYRSVISVHWPARIGYVLQLPFDDVFPLPDIVVAEMAATLARGHAVLLLSDDRARRDRVKAALYAMQTVGGCA